MAEHHILLLDTGSRPAMPSVRLRASGYSVDKVEHKLGQGASHTCATRFDDLFLEKDLRLGAEGAGYGIALSNLEAGRIGIAAQSVGMARAALDIAVAYAKDRRSLGQAIIQHQAVGFRLALLATNLEAARQLVLTAAAAKDAGEPCLTLASMAKLFASETAEAVVSGASQTLDGYRYLEEYGQDLPRCPRLSDLRRHVRRPTAGHRPCALIVRKPAPCPIIGTPGLIANASCRPVQAGDRATSVPVRARSAAAGSRPS